MMGAALDLAILILLVAACGGALVIGRKLTALQRAQGNLAEAIAQFDAASRRAEETLEKIEAMGSARNTSLSKAAQSAQALLDDLTLMTASGERIAERIEAAVLDVKKIGGAGRREA